jgi:hypothetical protein
VRIQLDALIAAERNTQQALQVVCRWLEVIAEHLRVIRYRVGCFFFFSRSLSEY